MRWSLLLLLASTLALAKPNTGAEASRVMEQFLTGSLALNPALNRIKYLGAEGYAASELVFAIRRSVDARQREKLLEMLSAIGVRHNDVEQIFLTALKSDNASEVMLGAAGLGRNQSANAVKPLIELLAHKVLGVRREAARALGSIARPAASAPLLKAARVETELEMKVLMIQSAGRAGDKKQIPALEALLKDESESTRLAAATGLCAMAAPACAKFAGKLLASTEKSERLQGVMLFEGATAKASSPTLTPVLKDADDKVRARAARILVQGGDATKLDWLVIESAKARGEVRLVYEDELERLRLTDEQRQAILKKAGLQ